MPPDSLASLLATATARLRAAGCDTPVLDARLLLQAAAGTAREGDRAHWTHDGEEWPLLPHRDPCRGRYSDHVLRRRRERYIPILDQRPVAPVARHQRPAPVGQDLEQPRIESRVFPEPGKTVVHANERVLHRFFGVLFATQHVAGEPEASRIVELHDPDERLLVAMLGARGKGRVEVAHGLAMDCKGVRQITPEAIGWLPKDPTPGPVGAHRKTWHLSRGATRLALHP